VNLETRLPADLWEAVRMNYEKRNFTGAILDAFYFLSDFLRKKSGAEGDGAALIGQALGGATPRIRLNRLQSESEWNVQKGVEQVLRGSYQAIRNPRSHEKTTDSEDDAQVLILFLGYLVRHIDQAKSQFSRTDFQKRVLDPDFVPQERYAQLLVDEIPVGQRFEVFLDIYRAKETGKAQHLRHFFSALLKRLTEDELRQVYGVLSEELKTADDEATIRMVIGSFDGDVWPHVDEVARLRVENRLVRSVREGRFDRHQRSCRGGALATWSTTLLPYFSLKQELLRAVWDKLRSGSDEEEDYIFEYVFNSLSSLADPMPSYLESTIRTKLKQGDGRFHEAMLISCPWDRKTWTPELGKAFDEFKEAEKTFKDVEDDTPF
jgi:uncharacterized protein (TIGR02391 family)